MALPKGKTKDLNPKELDKMLSGFLPKAPERMADGSIKTERWVTDVAALDEVTGGGFPKGHTIAIGAEKGAGKTTILIQAIGNIAEKYGKKVYYLDVEGGATPELVQSMGYADLLWNPVTNPDGKLYLLSIDTIQQFAVILKQIRANHEESAVVVLDSDTAIQDQDDLDKADLGTGNRAAASNARMWSQNAFKLQAMVKNSNLCLVLVHQARVDLSGFIAKTESAGGNAAKHMSTVEIWARRKEWIKKDFSKAKQAEAEGALIALTTKKNRLTVPFQVTETPIIFGKGASNKYSFKAWLENHTIADEKTGEVVDMLQQGGGGYYTLTLPSGSTRVKGMAEVWDLIDVNYNEIYEYIKTHGGLSDGLSLTPEEIEALSDNE